MIHLISDKLVELIEKHSDVILKRWGKLLIEDPTTSSFTESHLKFANGKAKEVLTNISQWVSYDTTKEDVGKRYANHGIELFEMGIPLCECIRAFVVLRRTLWVFVVNESTFDSSFELHQMSELSDRVILFFDRAQFYMIRGYTEAMHKKLNELCNCSPEHVEQIFFSKSFYNK